MQAAALSSQLRNDSPRGGGAGRGRKADVQQGKREFLSLRQEAAVGRDTHTPPTAVHATFMSSFQKAGRHSPSKLLPWLLVSPQMGKDPEEGHHAGKTVGGCVHEKGRLNLQKRH